MPLHRAMHHDHDAAELLAHKGDHTVSVCLPARDEGTTVGTIVETIRTELMEEIALVDEIIVVDDHSTDDTAAAARAAGADVVDAQSTLPDYTGPGKGQALWKSLHESTGDLVLWCDADIDHFGSHFVTGLLGPLLLHPEVSFVKGTYARPLVGGDGGGRVTELVARPLLANLFPELASIGQPLAGEYGGRRRLLERLPFVDGYGVDIALLVDAARAVGIDGIAEVDLGERRHRNRTLDELGPQATAVMRAALNRAGLDTRADHPVVLKRPTHEPLLLSQHELPPLVELPSYRRRSA
ncbi:glucosyl-3-phosphoglycerate synthase [Actinospongicola halichondriae]|uniref:glucosyl-3-phosphoglycerate synthase n=1 Tax=Actinospongicola halichondriae TaxID=3236844 RepID=UPI003D41A9F2